MKLTISIKIILFSLCLFFEIKAYSLAYGTYKIGSYNLENFWDYDPKNTTENWEKFTKTLSKDEQKKLKRSPQYRDYSGFQSNWHNPEILKQKISRVVEAIKAMGIPDILALQEIESASNESVVFQTPFSEGVTFEDKLKDLGYQYFLLGAQEENNPVSVTTAIISKIKMKSLEPIILESSQYSTSARDLQVAEITLPEERILLINNHWKSKQGKGNEKVRIEIAKQLKKRIEIEKQNDKLTHIVILGDLNSTFYEKPLLEMKALGSKKKMLGQSNEFLYNLWFDLEVEDRWEHSYDGTRGTLSHIVLSDSLFNQYGFHYINHSFQVLGQKNLEAKKFLDADGKPFRWQIKKQNGYSQHLGIGYSDHLPIIASFSYKAKPSNVTQKKQTIDNPIDIINPRPPKKPLLNKITPCLWKDAFDLLEFKNIKVKTLLKKCVKLEVLKDQKPIVLKTRGPYQSNYIEILSQEQKVLDLGLIMHNSYDWRPNIYDSRISEFDILSLPGQYSNRNWHPRSNKCFNRRVLQKTGGKLRKILGRIGYQSGQIFIHIQSRESKYLILEDLPPNKLKSCPWNS